MDSIGTWGPAALQVGGSILKGKSDSKQNALDAKIAERIARFDQAATEAREYASFKRDRQLWQSAMSPWAKFNKSPELEGMGYVEPEWERATVAGKPLFQDTKDGN